MAKVSRLLYRLFVAAVTFIPFFCLPGNDFPQVMAFCAKVARRWPLL